jgi:dephospho-CoA kinase
MPIDSRGARRAPARDGLFVVGLVGRAGSGKTTVAQALASEGAIVIEADRIGHQVTDHDPDVRRALEAEYGDGVYRPDGALNRARVAAKVFADPEARGRLDALVHPRILSAIRERLQGLRAEETRAVVVIDAALMLQWGLERECDAVLAVSAPQTEQIRRLMAARGWTESEARARLAAQWPDERYAAAADWTIENRGSVEELRAAAHEAMRELRSRAQA